MSPKIEAAVIKYHDFMDHCQFKMCFGIIYRHPAVFNHGNQNQNERS